MVNSPSENLSYNLSREETPAAKAFRKIMQQDFHPSPFYLEILMGRSNAMDGTNRGRDKAQKSLGKIHKTN